MNTPSFNELEAHEHFAKAINAEVWALLELDRRTAEQAERMVHAVHASCYHWLQVGTSMHRQRAEWLAARVYADLGLGEPALRHARRCLQLTDEHAESMKDFDLAYAQEGMARALAASGELDQARRYREAAESAGGRIADDEDRSIFQDDLTGGDWHGLG